MNFENLLSTAQIMDITAILDPDIDDFDHIDFQALLSENPQPAGRVFDQLNEVPLPEIDKAAFEALKIPKNGVNMKEHEYVMLLKTCSEYGDQFILNKTEKEFWDLIQLSMYQKINKKIGSPRQMVERLMDKHFQAEAEAKASSGKVIVESELTQACRAWKKWEIKVRISTEFFVC